MGVDRRGLPSQLEVPPFDPGEVQIVSAPAGKPPRLGVLLTLLAIGLALAPSRFLVAVLDVALSSHVDLMTLAVLILEMVVATWAIFNLYRLVKRRRSFLPSMVAFLAFNAGFTVLLNIEQCFSDPATQAEALATMALSVVLAGLWISYLLRSRHVQEVFVK